MSVPYALYAEKTNDDNQTLSINGSSLSISGGNSVMLPSGITNKIYQQDILNSFYFGGGPCSSELSNASSHVNAESFIVNQSFGLIQYKKDANTGLFYATGSNNVGCSVFIIQVCFTIIKYIRYVSKQAEAEHDIFKDH
jgi:hypothetical protein